LVAGGTGIVTVELKMVCVASAAEARPKNGAGATSNTASSSGDHGRRDHPRAALVRATTFDHRCCNVICVSPGTEAQSRDVEPNPKVITRTISSRLLVA
jgi:hypothetical protein